MPSNEELSARAKELIAAIDSLSKSAKSHADEYQGLANEAYASLQEFLKSKGVATVDEWLDICQKQLNPQDAAIVKKTLADLEPPKGLQALVQPTEIAKFIASWFIVDGAMPLFQAAALSAKAFYYNYLVVCRLPIVEAGAVAEDIAVSSVAASTEELAAAAEFVESGEVATLVTAAEVEIGEAVAADAAVAAEVAAVSTAEVAGSWNVFFLVGGGLVLAGTLAYQAHKKSQDADKLKDIIAKLATARLFAFVGEKSMLKQTDEHSFLRRLNRALKQPGGAESLKQEGLESIKLAMSAIDTKDCYDELVKQDRAYHAMTDADPTYQDMVRRHEEEVQALREKTKKDSAK